MATAAATAASRFARFRSTWLKDASTYPILGVLGFWATIAGVSGYHLLHHPDAVLNPRRRHNSVIVENTPEVREKNSEYYNHPIRDLQYRRKPEIFPSLNTLIRKTTLHGDVPPAMPPGMQRAMEEAEALNVDPAAKTATYFREPHRPFIPLNTDPVTAWNTTTPDPYIHPSKVGGGVMMPRNVAKAERARQGSTAPVSDRVSSLPAPN